jgi:hypothetical protein
MRKRKTAKIDFVVHARIDQRIKEEPAFEGAGIRFLDNEPGGGIGVRLKAPKA